MSDSTCTSSVPSIYQDRSRRSHKIPPLLKMPPGIPCMEKRMVSTPGIKDGENSTKEQPQSRASRWIEGTLHFPRRAAASQPTWDTPHRARHAAYHEIRNANDAERVYKTLQHNLATADPGYADDVPYFGGKGLNLEDHPLTRDQAMAVPRVLCAVSRVCDMEYCPLLLDLVPLLLAFLPEAVVYAVVVNMWTARPFYFGTSHRFFQACLAVFKDYLHRYFPETAEKMACIGADAEPNLSFVFTRAFVPLVPYKEVVQLMELYLEDGLCFFYRFGLTLMKEYKWRLKNMTLLTATEWWNQLGDLTYGGDFHTEGRLGHLLQQYRSRVRRRNLEKRIDKVLAEGPRAPSPGISEDIPPLHIVPSPVIQDTHTPLIPESHTPTTPTPGAAPNLLHSREYRKLLAQFLPANMRQRSVRMVYSSEAHGRTLATLYRFCRKRQPCFLVVEELHAGHVVGAFCTDQINNETQISGSGSSFVFRLSPPAQVYGWNNAAIRVLEETDVFQMATHRFFAVGANANDGPALKVDSELVSGSSRECSTYNNLPLCGANTDFDIHRVEVWELVVRK